jgi:AcrR family transcriptional regulator
MKPAASKMGETTDRIIAAAGAVFGERGFRATTIRQITTRAGVNLAAVNYHFKNKTELYIRVLKESKRHLAWLVIADIPGTPEEQLRGFIERFVQYLLDPKRPAWHARVLAMEMSSPTPALGVVIRDLTAPLYRDVRSLVARIAGDKAGPVDLDLLTNSIFSQCIFYASCRPVAEQLSVHLTRTPDRTKQIARHIASFSIAALKDLRRREPAEGNRAPRVSTRQLALS